MLSLSKFIKLAINLFKSKSICLAVAQSYFYPIKAQTASNTITTRLGGLGIDRRLTS